MMIEGEGEGVFMGGGGGTRKVVVGLLLLVLEFLGETQEETVRGFCGVLEELGWDEVFFTKVLGCIFDFWVVPFEVF